MDEKNDNPGSYLQIHTAVFNPLTLCLKLVVKDNIHLHTSHLPRVYRALAGPVAYMMAVPCVGVPQWRLTHLDWTSCRNRHRFCCASDPLALKRPSQQILVILGVGWANVTASVPEAKGLPTIHRDKQCAVWLSADYLPWRPLCKATLHSLCWSAGLIWRVSGETKWYEGQAPVLEVLYQ